MPTLPLPPPSAPPTAEGRRSRWVARLPYLALALFLGAIAALVWLTREYDEEEQRATLINDALWMEQNLRFQLDRNAAQLQQIAPDLLRAERLSGPTEAQLRQLLSPDRGLVQILWLDAEDRVRNSMPPQSEDKLIGEASGAVPSEDISRLARAVGRPVYGPAYPVLGDQTQFEAHVPAWGDEGFLGTIVGVYSLSDLVVRELPWWFSERYRVAVLDPDGREVASKSKVAPLDPGRAYAITFDPPGHGLTLQITPYKGETRWIPVLLSASMLLFAVIIVWSVWQLRRQLAARQAAEEAVRAESAYRRAMEDSLITGLRARDLSGRLTYVNSAFCRMTGYAAEELVGCKPPMPYWDPDHIAETQKLHEQIMAGGTSPEGVEVRLRRRNGERLDALVFEAPLIDAHGRQTGWMGSVLDITEQKRARELALQQEERLQATSRLVTMGEMASTLAHELNQPLAAITSYNTGCLNRLEADEFDRDELRDIHEKMGRQARRAADIIRRVHDFVRRAEPRREALDLNAVIREALGLVEPDARKRRIHLVADLAPDLPVVNADAVMIEQIIVNLVRNGMDAMQDTPEPNRSLRIGTRSAGAVVTVRVTDHGTGIDAETARHLFQPFFTTKQEGMGMGLNICRSIAELHHGRLGFEPAPDGGTIFTLTLPVDS